MSTTPVLKDKLTLVVLGRSGSGKGTQAKFMAKRLGGKRGVGHIVTGDLLRSFSKRKGFVPRRVKDLIAEGKLIPSWLISYLWSKELVERDYVKKHLIFDGAPRKVLEAMLLDEAMEWLGRPLPICVLIRVSEAEVTKRLIGRGRGDDTLAVIRNRLAYYPKDVIPVIKHYERQKRLLSVNGEQPVEEVSREINRTLRKRLGKNWPPF